MTNWDDAVARIVPDCPHCGADERYMEKDGMFWHCNQCSRRSPVLSRNDKRFLAGVKIKAEG